MHLADQIRNFRRRRGIVAEIGRDDVRGQINEILAGGFGHELNLYPNNGVFANAVSRLQSLRETLNLHFGSRRHECVRHATTTSRISTEYFLANGDNLGYDGNALQVKLGVNSPKVRSASRTLLEMGTQFLD